MRNLLALLAVAALTLAGVGWYLGWYTVESIPTTNGHRNVNIDIDAKKIGEDLKRGEEQLLEKGEKKLREKLETGKAQPGTARSQATQDAKGLEGLRD